MLGREQEDGVLRACNGDVEQSSFFGVPEALLLGEDQLHQRVILNLRGEAVHASRHPEDDDVVGLQALRAVHGLERQVEACARPQEFIPLLRPIVSISPEDQDARLRCLAFDSLERGGDRSRRRRGVPPDEYRFRLAFPDRTHLFVHCAIRRDESTRRSAISGCSGMSSNQIWPSGQELSEVSHHRDV